MLRGFRTLAGVILLSSVLAGCDTFYDVRYVPASRTSDAFVAAPDITADSLVEAMQKFAQKYSLDCSDEVSGTTVLHCHSGFRFLPHDHVFGGFGVETGEGHPFIHYHSAEPGLTTQASGCARVEEIKQRLEEFTGPLTTTALLGCATAQ